MACHPVQLSYYTSTVLVILATIFINSVCFGASIDGNLESSKNNVCKTPACLEAANKIIQNMNTSKKPCGNFYLFACGKFVKEGAVPRGQPYSIPLTIIENEIQEKIKDDLEQNIKGNEPRTFQLLKSYYEDCLVSDTNEVREGYTEAIFSLIEQLGGWPVLEGESWDESNFDWIDFIYNVHELGLEEAMNSLISSNRKIQRKEFKPYILIDKPSTRIKGMENAEVEEYYESMVRTAMEYGADEEQAKEELEKSLKFEMKLAKIKETKNLGIPNYTVNKLIKKNMTFPWNEYLKGILPKDVELDMNEKVQVNLKNFQLLLDVIENTEKRTIANYVLWRVILQIKGFLYDGVDDSEIKRTAPKTGHPLWKHCVNYLSENMPVAVGALFVRNHFNKSSITGVQEIVDNLMKSFKHLVSGTTSMNNDTKTTAEKKLDSMQIHVDYPDELLNDEIFDDYYEKLSDSTGNFLENHLALLSFNHQHNAQRSILYFNKNDWIEQGSTATKPYPEYQYRRNRIIVNTAIMENLFFNADVPNYLNYAGIGKALGHEISHAFDAVGSKFDEKGSRVNWLDAKALDEFKNDTICLAEQFNRYNASKRAIALNGKNTLSENIADVAGIKIAYAAYEEWIKHNGPEPTLPKLHYTPRQLFWLNVAQTECSRIRKKGWDNYFMDEHSPGPFRILGPLSNIPEFARDFNCPIGSRMNPSKKCSFWWNRNV